MIRPLLAESAPSASEDALVQWTIGLVLVTAGLVAATLLLVWIEARARADDRRADVEAEATPDDLGAGMYLQVRVENHGPANARNLACEVWIDLPGEAVADDLRHRHREGLFPARRHRTFLPDITSGAASTMHVLSDRGAIANATWSWDDDRALWPWRRKRQERSWRRPVSEIAEGYYKGVALIEHTVLSTLQDLAKDVHDWTTMSEAEMSRRQTARTMAQVRRRRQERAEEKKKADAEGLDMDGPEVDV